MEPSGYALVVQEGELRIYCYDTDGDKVDWKDPGDEGYDEWADALGYTPPPVCDECGRVKRGENGACEDC